MSAVVPHAERVTLSVWVDEPNGDKVIFDVEGAPVGHSQRLVNDRVVDGSPDIDDAYAALQESIGFVSYSS